MSVELDLPPFNPDSLRTDMPALQNPHTIFSGVIARRHASSTKIEFGDHSRRIGLVKWVTNTSPMHLQWSKKEQPKDWHSCGLEWLTKTTTLLFFANWRSEVRAMTIQKQQENSRSPNSGITPDLSSHYLKLHTYSFIPHPWRVQLLGIKDDELLGIKVDELRYSANDEIVDMVLLFVRLL